MGQPSNKEEGGKGKASVALQENTQREKET